MADPDPTSTISVTHGDWDRLMAIMRIVPPVKITPEPYDCLFVKFPDQTLVRVAGQETGKRFELISACISKRDSVTVSIRSLNQSRPIMSIVSVDMPL